jgi:hypothetical protein
MKPSEKRFLLKLKFYHHHLGEAAPPPPDDAILSVAYVVLGVRSARKSPKCSGCK